MQACLLLLLAEQPDHGYDLVSRLPALGFDGVDAATTYRALRGLERAGSVTSRWTPSNAGPARRVYRLTARGRTVLADYGGLLRHDQVQVTRYLCRLDEIVNTAAQEPDGAGSATSSVS